MSYTDWEGRKVGERDKSVPWRATRPQLERMLNSTCWSWDLFHSDAFNLIQAMSRSARPAFVTR